MSFSLTDSSVRGSRSSRAQLQFDCASLFRLCNFHRGQSSAVVRIRALFWTALLSEIVSLVDSTFGLACSGVSSSCGRCTGSGFLQLLLMRVRQGVGLVVWGSCSYTQIYASGSSPALWVYSFLLSLVGPFGTYDGALQWLQACFETSKKASWTCVSGSLVFNVSASASTYTALFFHLGVALLFLGFFWGQHLGSIR